MSLSGMDRKLPHLVSRGERDLASEIAAALRREYGDLPATVKQIARLANAKERTVKNWLAANNGPSGDKLVALMRHSDQVLEVVLRMSGRQELLRSSAVDEVFAKMQASLRTMEELFNQNAS
jgi:hypothetical protein